VTGIPQNQIFPAADYELGSDGFQEAVSMRRFELGHGFGVGLVHQSFRVS